MAHIPQSSELKYLTFQLSVFPTFHILLVVFVCAQSDVSAKAIHTATSGLIHCSFQYLIQDS